MSWLYGSWGAREGAKTAQTAMTATIARPIAPGQWRATRVNHRASGSAGTAARSAMTDPGIEVPNDEVRGQVHEGNAGAEHHDRSLDDRVVEGPDSLDGEPANPRPGEDDLDDHGAGEKPPELEPDHRHEGDAHVLERVLPEHSPLGDPLGPARPNIVLAQHLEHARADEPHHHG